MIWLWNLIISILIYYCQLGRMLIIIQTDNHVAVTSFKKWFQFELDINKNMTVAFCHYTLPLCIFFFSWELTEYDP